MESVNVNVIQRGVFTYFPYCLNNPNRCVRSKKTTVVGCNNCAWTSGIRVHSYNVALSEFFVRSQHYRGSVPISPWWRQLHSVTELIAFSVYFDAVSLIVLFFLQQLLQIKSKTGCHFCSDRAYVKAIVAPWKIDCVSYKSVFGLSETRQSATISATGAS